MNFQMFKLDLEKAEETDQISNMCWENRKSTRVPEKHLLLLYWLRQSFDCVDHNKLWKTLKEMWMPDHLTCLLRNLYAGQEATVRTGNGTADCFQIGKGVRQGCVLPPSLFNLYAEYIMRNARLDEAQAGIRIAGRNINNLRYADKSLLMKEESEKVDIKLNIQKTKIMASGPITSWQTDGNTKPFYLPPKKSVCRSRSNN